MIYDKKIVIAKLPEGVGTPLQAPLEPVFTAFCGELEVFHTRYWEAVQAGSRVDILVELPFLRKIDAGMYARYQGNTYSIVQAQFGTDRNGLPITTLSLKRSEDQYDIEGL
jgi:hypothetical protein